MHGDGRLWALVSLGEMDETEWKGVGVESGLKNSRQTEVLCVVGAPWLLKTTFTERGDIVFWMLSFGGRKMSLGKCTVQASWDQQPLESCRIDELWRRLCRAKHGMGNFSRANGVRAYLGSPACGEREAARLDRYRDNNQWPLYANCNP